MKDHSEISRSTGTRRLIDIRAVCAKIGGSREINKATVYRWMAQGRLPRPVRIGPRLVRWIEAEVDEAIQRRAEARDAATE